MVTLDYIKHSALQAYKSKQTAIAGATLKALGVPIPKGEHPSKTQGYSQGDGRYDDILECFANPDSFMDRV